MSAAVETAAARAPDAIAFPVARGLRSRDVFRLIPRVWPFVRPYRRHLAYLFLLTLPAIGGGLFLLEMTRILFDVVAHGAALTGGEAWLLHVPMHADRHTVLVHACWVGALASIIAVPIAGGLLGYGIWILQRISNLFRVNLYTRLQELSVQFHAQEKIGDAIFRMFQDSAAIPQVINGLIVQPMIVVPLAAGSLFWLVLYDLRMAVIAALLIPVNFVLAWWYGARLRAAFIGEREAAAQATTRIEETLASIQAVKAFGTEAAEAGRYAQDNWAAFMAARRARLMLVRYRVIANTLRGLGYVAAMYAGALQVMAGGTAGLAHAAVSLGLFQGSLSLFAGASGRTRHMTDLWGSLQDVVVAMARVLEMLARTPEQAVSSGHLLPSAAPAALRFDGVSFGYDPRAPVLRDVSFVARPGQLTAIAGASGAGKSTIIGLAVRFFDPAAGRILLDGVDVRDFDLAAWRGMLSVALQENPLFTATIRDNVAYGRPDARAAELALAVERAGLGPFVRSLPAGLDTMLGEKGAKLSAGQAQRIGLARALLRDAPILLLDEPTSALDGATEELVMRGLRDWLEAEPERRMAIIATHRRTTAARADRIYQIAAGRVAAADAAAFDLAAPGEIGDG